MDSSADNGICRRLLRDDITQALLRMSEQDLNDRRSRFVPRSALTKVINFRYVTRLLGALPGQHSSDLTRLRELAHLICPDPGQCTCHDAHCTGGRMILATLLFLGKEDLVPSLFDSQNASICDRSLPLHLGSAKANEYESSRVQLSMLLRGLSRKEMELFIGLQWQLCTPFLTDFTPDSDHCIRTFPDQMTLPWTEVERIGSFAHGETSYVERIKIHPDNHNLPYGEDDAFALKTIEERMVPGLANEKFRQEVQANRDLPKHERIVPLLTAFKHRGRYYQIFPHATARSLQNVWESYTPSELIEGSTTSAHWYSAKWLVNECRGVAAALMVVHQLDGEAHLRESPRLLHADIQPENILCFKVTKVHESTILLKLADFGEAKRIKPDTPLKAGRIAHVKAYRPPEYSHGNTISLEYDIWCLGCLFLDFVTWAVLGRIGIDSFRAARVEEQDDPSVTEAPGQVIEDIFFKKVLMDPRSPTLSWPISEVGGSMTGIKPRQATMQIAAGGVSRVRVCSQLKNSVVLVSVAIQFLRRRIKWCITLIKMAAHKKSRTTHSLHGFLEEDVTVRTGTNAGCSSR